MYNFNVKVDQRPFLTLGHIFAKPKDQIAKEEMNPLSIPFSAMILIRSISDRLIVSFARV